MGLIRIAGGKALNGSVQIQGSKNAALPILAASLLHDGKTILHNCPRIRDIEYMIEIMKLLGVQAEWAEHTLYLDCTQVVNCQIPRAYADKMRASLTFMGALLGRTGSVAVAHPGGCIIGARPIDMHLEILSRLGASIQEEDGMIRASAARLKGCEYTFPKISVGATQQGVLAAVRAEGVTRLYNCAAEPEVEWLIQFLNKRGARIERSGTEIMISGVQSLSDAEFVIPPDRIVAGTYLLAGAITRGRVCLTGVLEEEMSAILNTYQKMGGQYKLNSGKLFTDSSNLKNPVAYIRTQVYPGFPTDLQSPLLAVLSTVRGISSIEETIFEDRFKVASDLCRMGADIRIQKNLATIYGGKALHGERLKARELRGGAALVLAGLAADGETIVENCEYIERGYEHICEDLAALGGKISKDTG